MKGIILCGGNGKRLSPLTKTINKHMLPVGQKPMISYPVESLIESGIQDILFIVNNYNFPQIINYLGSGIKGRARFFYRVQEEPAGVAHAISLARGFLRKKEKFIVVLADNIYEEPLQPFINLFDTQAEGAMVLIKKVQDPERYGVAEIENERIINIVEKPRVPKSNYCVTGIYMYDESVFEIIEKLTISERNEYEITDVNNIYAKEGKLRYGELKGYWIDAGTFESLYKANMLIHRQKNKG